MREKPQNNKSNAPVTNHSKLKQSISSKEDFTQNDKDTDTAVSEDL